MEYNLDEKMILHSDIRGFWDLDGSSHSDTTAFVDEFCLGTFGILCEEFVNFYLGVTPEKDDLIECEFSNLSFESSNSSFLERPEVQRWVTMDLWIKAIDLDRLEWSDHAGNPDKEFRAKVGGGVCRDRECNDFYLDMTDPLNKILMYRMKNEWNYPFSTETWYPVHVRLVLVRGGAL